ncbi:nuclear transport factor 2 family protein [Patulibacter defluvii]|uniref:nuclear transport factor 2 family protein n=1 Tax=Patulibacter defluvii TaxID=3095358 RepID=UPI002A764305|nr:nuclear transport factor 2 family protein [Patulibacter sp. DM4]
MTASPVEVAAEVYASFNRGDIARVAELFDPEIEWVEPQGYFVPEGRGVRRGREVILGLLDAFGRYWSSFQVHADRIWDGGDGEVLMWGRQVGVARETGRTYEGPVANLWVVRDGLITRHESVGDTWSIADALGGRDG